MSNTHFIESANINTGELINRVIHHGIKYRGGSIRLKQWSSDTPKRF